MPQHRFLSAEDFAAAYGEYADAIFRHCYLRTFHRERAKELMAGTFMGLWQFVAAGNDIDSTQMMLYRIAHGLIVREKAGSTGGADTDENDAPDLRPREFAVLNQVPAEDRCVMVLHFVDGFSLQEITSIVGGALQDHALSLRKGSSLLSSLLAHD